MISLQVCVEGRPVHVAALLPLLRPGPTVPLQGTPPAGFLFRRAFPGVLEWPEGKSGLEESAGRLLHIRRSIKIGRISPRLALRAAPAMASVGLGVALEQAQNPGRHPLHVAQRGTRTPLTPVLDHLGQAARRRLPPAGTPQAIASRAARPKLSLSDGSSKRSAQGSTRSISPRCPRAPAPGRARPAPRRTPRPACSSGPSPTSRSRAGISLRDAARRCDHVERALHRPEVAHVQEHLLAGLAAKCALISGHPPRRIAVGVHEVVDDLRCRRCRTGPRASPPSGAATRPSPRRTAEMPKRVGAR